MHSPTLRTIKMVEETLKNMPDSETTIPKLKRMLPRKVNHNTLMQIIRYLSDERKIYFDMDAVVWTHNPKLRAIIKENRKLSGKTV